MYYFCITGKIFTINKFRMVCTEAFICSLRQRQNWASSYLLILNVSYFQLNNDTF